MVTCTRGSRLPASAPPASPAAPRSAPAFGKMLKPLLSRDLAPHRIPAGIPPRGSDPGTRGGAGSAEERGAGPARGGGARARSRGAGLPGPVDRRCHRPDRPRGCRRVRMLRAQGRALGGGVRPPALLVPARVEDGGCCRRVSLVSARGCAGPAGGRPEGEEGPGAGKSPERVPGWRPSDLRPPRARPGHETPAPRPCAAPTPGPTRVPGRAGGSALTGSQRWRCCVRGRVAREDLSPQGRSGRWMQAPAACPSHGPRQLP